MTSNKKPLLTWKQFLKIAASLTLLLSTGTAEKAQAASVLDLKDSVPPADTLISLPRAKVGPQFIDGLKQAVNFKDYEVECQLFTKKGDTWKSFGAAKLCYKQHDLLRATIKSSDYRDGSLIVKQADGSVRARGGGMLRSLTMNIEPNARSIRLPTGYSLASSDFISLYEAVRRNLAHGTSATATNGGINLKLFKQPVLVLVIGNGASEDKISEVVFLHPATKLPLGWGTYKDGQPYALVVFEGLSQNKGFADDLFRL